VLIGNAADENGGGAYGGTLKVCTVISNTASQGGGVLGSRLSDCTLKGNHAFWCGGGA